MDEKRRASRHRVLKTGTIEFDRRVYRCVVRNLSDIGAALELFYTLSIPDKFKLVLADDVGRDCYVVWHHENRLGIAFTARLDRPVHPRTS
jgi:PilZ domain